MAAVYSLVFLSIFWTDTIGRNKINKQLNSNPIFFYDSISILTHTIAAKKDIPTLLHYFEEHAILGEKTDDTLISTINIQRYNCFSHLEQKYRYLMNEIWTVSKCIDKTTLSVISSRK